MARRAKIKWRPQKAVEAVQDEAEKRMKKACQHLEAEAKKLVSRGNKGGGNPSKPFEPPKTVSGTLKSNISYEVHSDRDKVVGVIGVKTGEADNYALRLELGYKGTDKKGRSYDQKPRPYLRQTVKNETNKLREILGSDYTI